MKTKRKLLLSLSILTALVNILIMSSGVYGSVIQINNSNDSGPGTLRQALLDAVSGDTIVFDITVFPPTSPAIIAITSGQLPAITQGNLTIDASNAGVVLDGSACENCMGFTVASDSNIIKGFQIQNFPLDGIRIGESNNPSFNTIGGERTKGTGPNGEGNTIVGCGASGIAIYGSNVSNNIVIGNYVGVDVTGVFSMPNGRGVNIRAPSNTIGSALPDERNVISGNRDAGVWIETSNGHHNVIIGNYIGTNAAGTDSLGNGTGVMISRFEGGPTSNTIGGSSANERNIISGNDYTGVLIEGSGSSVNIVRGNFIGTDVTGTKRLPNGPSGKGVFVFNGANDNIIGGSNPNEGNVISGNDYAGVEIHGAGTTGNQVQGNYIGTDVSGTIALVNREKGVFIFNGAQYNMVGGSDVGARNIISGNNGSGIILESTGTTNNIVKGNFIGTDISGTVPLPNRDDGVGISDGASNNTLGGEIEGERNIISGNSDNGIAISGSTTENNNVIGNYIGTDVSGKNALSNGVQGVSVTNGAKHNLIGGNKPGSGLWAGNLIKGNTGRGIEFTSSSAMITNNTIVDNNNGGLAAYSNSSVEIKNNIIVQNQGGGILTDESSTSKIAYNDVWKNRTDYSGCSAGTGDISANPFFVDPTRHNYHLQLGSPCIDAGNPDIAYNDIDATRNDMGAYGGPHGESYTYPDGPPFIDGSATFTSGFVEPGNPVTIYSLVYDLVGSVVSVVAEIESPDETLLTNLPLYDDGVHNDVAAGDNVWANSWTTEEMPRTYFVDIIAIDNNSNTAVIENVALFTTDRSTLPLQLTSSRGNDENPALCQTSDGDVWLFWNSNRDGYAQIWYKKRNDGGVTWSNDQRLSTRQDCHSPSVAQSSDGKIWLFWYETRGQDIWYVTSSDYGNTWSPLQQFTTNPSVDERPNVATDANGKMVVVWNSWRTGNHDVFCKVSLDNGNTWTNPIQITSHLAMDEDPSVVIDANGSIHVVWYWQHDYIKYSESSDNGGTWNEPIILTSGLGGISRHPAIDLDSSGKIWLTFNHWESRRNESRSDLFYTISTNSFEWTAPIQITQFAGYDGFSDIATINNQQWLVWHSERAVNFDIWAGKTDFIQDMNPPPTAYWVKHQPYSPAPTASDEITIQAKVADESAIASVYLVYSVNNQGQSKLVMYDDGNHNDGAVGDDIWAIAIGKYPAGTIIDYQVEVRDIAGNTIRSPEYPAQAEVLEPFVQKSNLLLVADYMVLLYGSLHLAEVILQINQYKKILKNIWKLVVNYLLQGRTLGVLLVIPIFIEIIFKLNSYKNWKKLILLMV